MSENPGPRCDLNEYGVMLSRSRVEELRRGAIVAYKRVLGVMRTPV